MWDKSMFDNKDYVKSKTWMSISSSRAVSIQAVRSARWRSHRRAVRRRDLCLRPNMTRRRDRSDPCQSARKSEKRDQQAGADCPCWRMDRPARSRGRCGNGQAVQVHQSPRGGRERHHSAACRHRRPQDCRKEAGCRRWMRPRSWGAGRSLGSLQGQGGRSLQGRQPVLARAIVSAVAACETGRYCCGIWVYGPRSEVYRR